MPSQLGSLLNPTPPTSLPDSVTSLRCNSQNLVFTEFTLGHDSYIPVSWTGKMGLVSSRGPQRLKERHNNPTPKKLTVRVFPSPLI